ncbi:MAG: ketopantoate reductase family protein [Spirochaetales bacterium]|nr:ketopantoate reductase family protein [Spirochaetales bacterium]
MNSIHSVAIIGAGALGMLYASALKKTPDTEVHFLAGDDRYESLKAGRFVINDFEEQIDVRSAAQLREHPDLVIVAVKNHHLEEIVPLLRAAIGADTVVTSVLNGIDSEPFIEDRFPDATVLYCVALGMDAVRTANRLTFTNQGKLIIGTKDNDPRNPDLLAVGELLDRSGLTREIPDDIHRAVWWKWMINIGVNQVSAVTGAPYGVFHTDEHAQALMEAAMRETVLVAQAEGVDLREEDIANWYPILNRLGAEGKTSMLQDMEEHRRTEAPSFGGRLIELAARHGIPVPVNETLVRIITIRELLYLQEA